MKRWNGLAAGIAERLDSEVRVHRLLAGAVLIYVAISAASAARGDEIIDPLHGYIGNNATDNGTNTPISVNPPTNIGFTVSPGPATGDFLLDILVPNNEVMPASFSITGTSSAIAGEFSATPWTSGDLDAYLGISASPSNPIGAFLPMTPNLDPGATGFFVFQVDLGTTTLQGPDDPGASPLLDLNIPGGVPLASYIVGFLNEGTSASPNWVATANSGAIFETAPPPNPKFGSDTPEPSRVVALCGLGAIGLIGFGWHRRQRAA